MMGKVNIILFSVRSYAIVLHSFMSAGSVCTETAAQPGILKLSISVTSILDYRNAIGTEHSDIPLQKALVLKFYNKSFVKIKQFSSLN